MAFLRNLLATLLGLFIFFLIGFFVLVGFISASEDVPEVKSNSVLYFNMSGVLLERTVSDPLAEMFHNAPPQHSLLDIIYAIDEAKKDDRIKGLYIEPMYMVGGYAGFQEIRDAILKFKSSGKFVYAYGEYISESDYYVASAADSLFINPTGDLEFNGLRANVTFYKGLFEKLDIEPEIFRVGDFKSYVEPYMRKDMSDENRLQYSSLLLSMYDTYLRNLSLNVDKSVEELNNISNLMKIRLPKDAKALGMIHKVGYKDELKSVMKHKLRLDEDEKLRFINVKSYVEAIERESEYSKNKVAVIVAQGDITMGGDEGIVGETFAKEIRKARENKSVKAIVMRVNSGGGSMTASDLIWRELMLTKGKKPIIASMSNAAASGGYYIAMPADTIIAQPNTITGSIGIFGMWLNFTNFLENKLGITHDVVKTGEFADIYTVTRELNSYERQIIQSTVEDGYETFIAKVAENRSMSIDSVKAIAGGRVWSGEQAIDLGLIDMLGSFEDAVELAADRAGIADDFRVSYYPRQKPFIEELLDRLSVTVRVELFGEQLDPIQNQTKKLFKMQGLQARMPGELTIH